MRGRPRTDLRRLVDRQSGRRRRAPRRRWRTRRRSTRRRYGRARSPRRRGSAPVCPPSRSSCWCCSGSSTALRIFAPSARGPDDEELAAVGADVDLAVGQHRRRFLQRCRAACDQSALPVLDVEGVQRRAAVDLVEPRARRRAVTRRRTPSPSPPTASS